MTDSVYCFRHVLSKNGNLQKKLTFAPSLHSLKDNNVKLSGMDDSASTLTGKSELHAQLDEYSNSLVGICSQQSNSLMEINELRNQVAKARYFLDAISAKLDSLSISLIPDGSENGIGCPTEIISPTMRQLPAYKPLYNGKNVAESIYVGFANEEHLACIGAQNIYDHDDAIGATHLVESKVKSTVHEDQRCDSASVTDFVTEPFFTDDFLEPNQLPHKQKSPNTGNSAYHAHELLNDYYA